MCDLASHRRSWLIALTLVAAATSPRPAHAQSTGELRVRLLAATRRSQILKDSVKALHEMRTLEFPSDSLAVGELKFRFLKSNVGADLQASLQAAGTHAMSLADSMFGDAVRGIAGTTSILATRSRWRFGQFSTVDMVPLHLAASGGRPHPPQPPHQPTHAHHPPPQRKPPKAEPLPQTTQKPPKQPYTVSPDQAQSIDKK